MFINFSKKKERNVFYVQMKQVLKKSFMKLKKFCRVYIKKYVMFTALEEAYKNWENSWTAVMYINLAKIVVILSQIT